VIRLERELGWRAPGHDMMVEALLASMLVDLARLTPTRDDAAASSGEAELVARFRNLLERVYRQRMTVGDYVKALGVSETRLRTACRNVAGSSPVRMATERVMAEARRMLVYSSMTVGETAEALGFDDPAYFTRLFTQTVGLSPRAYRASSLAGVSMDKAAPKSSRA
jgi:AraC family transcriptional activator of pobA